MSTPRVAVVLGGGGAKAAAHLGAAVALRELGISPVHWIGTSMASVVAAAMAGGADPATLLALTAAVYGRCPAAALLKVPVQSFHFSTELSPAATAQMEKALEHVRRWIDESTSKQAQAFQKVPW